jgi:heptosyltransferase-3
MGEVWVFHRGALGDSVLAWPFLRRLRREGARVTLIADGAKARLASEELGIAAMDAEQPRFAALWRGEATDSHVDGIERVVTFMVGPDTPAGRGWLAAAGAMFPGATIETLPAPIERPMALELGRGGGEAPARLNPTGPVVLHVGAGSRNKRWPMERWESLAQHLGSKGLPLEVLAGEVEAKQFDAGERAALTRMNGRILESLSELAATLRSARAFVGCDSGPTHLASQLGIPTLALFGPTDPARWAPLGPRVEVASPAGPRPMDWLDAGDVARLALATAGTGP